jgi:hypothetical protein
MLEKCFVFAAQICGGVVLEVDILELEDALDAVGDYFFEVFHIEL